MHAIAMSCITKVQAVGIDVLKRHLIAHGDLLIDSQAPRRETAHKCGDFRGSLSPQGARIMIIISRASEII